MDNAFLDYNYERLRECINSMAKERIRYGLLPMTIVESEQYQLYYHIATILVSFQIYSFQMYLIMNPEQGENPL